MSETEIQNQEAVMIMLDGFGLDEAIYQTCDLDTLEGRLIQQIELGGVGELDGHEGGPMGTIIYLYGPDAERLFSAVEPILVSYPLCQNSKVIIRSGAPGAEERERELVFPFRKAPSLCQQLHLRRKPSDQQ